MELRKVDKQLVAALLASRVEHEAIVGIVLMMETEAQKLALTKWLCENKEADTSDILGEAVEISNRVE